VLDPDPRQLSCRDGRIVMARGIGEALPFADASFEIVLVHSTLDHCIDASRTLDECGRVLVPGGILSIVLNNDRSWAKRLAPGEARRRRLQASRHHNVFVSGTGMVREVRRRGYSVEYFRGGRYLLLPPSLLKGATRAMGTRAMTRTMRLCDRVGDALAPRLGGDFYLLARKGAER
jgi:SAM-dependent methyltransferase